MGELRHAGISLSLFAAVIVTTMLASGSAFATDLIILRQIPPHNAIEPTPPNSPTVSVQVERGDLVQSLLSGPKMSDDDYGAVVASPPGRGGVAMTTNDAVGTIDGTRGDALSNVPNGGMGSFSSLNGIGGEISGQVNNAVQNGLQGLSSAVGAATGGQ